MTARGQVTIREQPTAQQLRQAQARVCCALCGQPSGANPYGCWCADCYREVIGEMREYKDRACLEKQWRIPFYTARAEKELPLFHPPL